MDDSFAPKVASKFEKARLSWDRTKTKFRIMSIGCDIVGVKEQRVIYFPISWGAKEPQNLPNHRVDIEFDHKFMIWSPTVCHHVENFPIIFYNLWWLITLFLKLHTIHVQKQGRCTLEIILT